VTKIIEIVPDDIPQWLREAVENGQSLQVCIEKINIATDALESLAKLGNGNQWGNSDGNKIAQKALKELKDPDAELGCHPY